MNTFLINSDFLNITTSPNLRCICHFQDFRNTCWKTIEKFTIVEWNFSYPKEVHTKISFWEAKIILWFSKLIQIKINVSLIFALGKEGSLEDQVPRDQQVPTTLKFTFPMWHHLFLEKKSPFFLNKPLRLA